MTAPVHGNLSVGEMDALSVLRQRLQRDINCLSDPDRMTRRRALSKIQKHLFQDAKVEEPVLRAFLVHHMSSQLVTLLQDPVEKCRELAGTLLLSGVDSTRDVPGDTSALALQVFPMVEARLGVLPFLEPAEEIRAQLLKLCISLLSRESGAAFGSKVAGSACGTISVALSDSFPEVKRGCCLLLLRLGTVCPGEVRLRAGKILRPLVLNLGHQHSRTRQLTLQAMGALLVCGADDQDKVMTELVLPQLVNMVYDRTVLVRKELAAVLASLVEAGIVKTRDSAVGIDGHRDDNQVGGRGKGSGVTIKLEGGTGEECKAQEGGGARGSLTPFRAQLVSLLLMLQSDESEEVQEVSKKLLDAVAESWGKTCPAAVDAKRAEDNTLMAAQAAVTTTSPAPATSPSSAPPAQGQDHAPSRALALPPATRAMCVSLLSEVLPHALEDSVHWKVRDRCRAVHLLSCVTRYVRNDVTAYLPALLSTLGEASRDDEPDVRKAVKDCAKSLGTAVAELSSITDILLPVLAGEVSGRTGSQHLCEASTILRPVVVEVQAVKLKPLFGAICQAQCSKDLLRSEVDDDLWEAVFMMCQALLDSDLKEEMRRPHTCLHLLRVLLWLLAGCDGVREESSAVSGLVHCLARINAFHDPQDLFDRYFTDLLGSVLGGEMRALETQGGNTISIETGITSGGEGKEIGHLSTKGIHSGVSVSEGWGKESPQREGFSVLLRSAPKAVGKNLSLVMPIFRGLLHNPERDAELRLSMLALLESVLSHDEVTEEGLRVHSQSLLLETIMPNGIWRAGVVASTVRKVAMATLHTLLRGGKVGIKAIYATTEQMLPVLKTNLEDYDPSTRHMTCLSLKMLFSMLPGALGEEPVRQIYPELLKRLDDSNDLVRRSVCTTMEAFFKATPPQNIRGTILEYSCEQLLVHLDDEDEAMQDAVFSLLKVAASIDPAPVRKLAAGARASHRNPARCDYLVGMTTTIATD